MRLPPVSPGVQRSGTGVFAKGLLGHRLLAYVAQEHYVQGTTMGRLARQLGLHRGSLLGAMHDLAARLESVPDRLVQEYRRGFRSSTRMRRAGATMAGTDMRGSFARRA